MEVRKLLRGIAVDKLAKMIKDGQIELANPYEKACVASRINGFAFQGAGTQHNLWVNGHIKCVVSATVKEALLEAAGTWVLRAEQGVQQEVELFA